MRVIREPSSPEYHGKFTCKTCKAELAYDKSDVRSYPHDPDGIYVECPFCKTKQDVTPGDGH